MDENGLDGLRFTHLTDVADMNGISHLRQVVNHPLQCGLRCCSERGCNNDRALRPIPSGQIPNVLQLRLCTGLPVQTKTWLVRYLRHYDTLTALYSLVTCSTTVQVDQR